MVESQERILPANSVGDSVAKVWMAAVAKGAADVGAAFVRERRAQEVET